MAEGHETSRDESEEILEHAFKCELRELHDLHTLNGDSLHRNFSPPIKDALFRLSSEEDYIYDSLLPESSDSSRTPDITESPREMTPISSPDNTRDHWDTRRNVYKFIHDEFMTATKDQRMEKFRQFLGQVKEKASCMRLPEGSSLIPDKTAALQHCLTAVRTMKDVIGSKCESVLNLVKAKVPTEPSSGAGSSLFPGARQTREVFNPGSSGGTQQNVSARNPGVIVQNPMHDRLPRTGQQTFNVASPIQGNPTHPTLQSFSKVDKEEETPRKRHKMERQPHVDEED